MTTTQSPMSQNTRRFEAPHEHPVISLREQMLRSVRQAYGRLKERIPITRSRDTQVEQLKHEIKLLKLALNEKDDRLRRIDLIYEYCFTQTLQDIHRQILELQDEVHQIKREQSMQRTSLALLEKEYKKLYAIEVKLLDPHKNKVFSVINSCVGTARKGLTLFSAQSHASHVNTPVYNHIYQPFVNSADLF